MQNLKINIHRYPWGVLLVKTRAIMIVFNDERHLVGGEISNTEEIFQNIRFFGAKISLTVYGFLIKPGSVLMVDFILETDWGKYHVILHEVSLFFCGNSYAASHSKCSQNHVYGQGQRIDPAEV